MTSNLTVSQECPPVIQRLASQSRFAAFSPVALRLMRLINEDAPFSDLARLITTDPSISSEVLRLSNSAVFNLRAEIKSILHALAIIGRDRTEMIVFTACLWRFLPRAPGGDLIRRCWRHNLASALLCEHMIDCVSRMDHVYTAALLHGMGQLALVSEYPEHYQRALEMAVEDGRSLIDHENETFGASAFQIAEALFQHWSMPDDLVQCATSRSVEPRNLEIAAIVQAGCHVADKLGFSVCLHGSHERLDDATTSPFTEKLMSVPWLLEVIAEKVNKVECSLT
ncbi:MAG TPA: HDOD domain-containing protein [Bryobacteraceae bacterium]|nr:HDOD domain-containing protein [Bryobacteraceae bacterium]